MRSQSKENTRTRRKWNDEEDGRLLDCVKRFGLDAWRSISAHMGDRDPKQCRERYMNHLDPNVKKEKLSLLEWKALLVAHDEFGNKCAPTSSPIVLVVPMCSYSSNSFMLGQFKGSSCRLTPLRRTFHRLARLNSTPLVSPHL